MWSRAVDGAKMTGKCRWNEAISRKDIINPRVKLAIGCEISDPRQRAVRSLSEMQTIPLRRIGKVWVWR